MKKFVYNPVTQKYDIYSLDPYRKIGSVDPNSLAGQILQKLPFELVRELVVGEEIVAKVIPSSNAIPIGNIHDDYELVNIKQLGGLIEIRWRKKARTQETVKPSEDTKQVKTEESKEQDVKQKKPKKRGRPPKNSK